MSLKEQLRLLSDMDGVWAHSQPPIIETFNKRFGTNLTYSDWTTFGLMTLEAVRLSGESIPVVAAWLYSEEVMRNSQVVPGANDAIKVLASIVKSNEITTSRPSAQASMTHEWVKENLPEIDRVYIRGEQDSAMKGDQFKIVMIRELEANIYIEDDPSVIMAVHELLLEGKLPFLKSAILVDRPWNDKVILPEAIQRVGNWREEDYGWDEIVQIVQKLANL